MQWRALPDGRGEFSVRDTGPGIAPEHISRLTERFYRVDRSRSRETGGTGLGLAIVKHVVQRHGGELKIESTPGAGSTFAILFPASRLRARRQPRYAGDTRTARHRIAGRMRPSSASATAPAAQKAAGECCAGQGPRPW